MRTELFDSESRPDIYTFHAARELLEPALADAIVGESRLSRLPLLRQRGHDPGRWRYLLPYMPRYFRSLDLSRYDLVISSSHAFAAAVLPPPDAAHVVYCHTPIRYVWLGDTDRRVGGVRAAALGSLRGWLRRQDLESSPRRPDVYVANSTAVQERIRRFYSRDAVVVPPPVDVQDFDATTLKESPAGSCGSTGSSRTSDRSSLPKRSAGLRTG